MIRFVFALLLFGLLVSGHRDLLLEVRDVDDVDVKDVHVRPQFANHVRKFAISRQMTRNNDEVKVRFSNYKRSAALIKEHNRKGATYRMGENEFMTMTVEERKLRTGLANVTSVVHKRSLSPASRLQLREAAPETFDHRDYDRVSSVQNQEDCGSCWTYSTVYTLEGEIAMLSDRPAAPLSVQEILSCTFEEDKDRNGCNGGWYMDGWGYVQKTGRLASDGDIPYLEMDLTCDPSIEQTPNAFKDYTLVDWERVPEGDDSALALFASKHVLAVAVDSLGLFFYYEGLFVDEYCGTPAKVDHAMTLVGYDREAWVVKNSWGEDWGESGYVRMSRGLPSHCGIADYAYFPIVEKKKSPAPVEELDEDGNNRMCFYY